MPQATEESSLLAPRPHLFFIIFYGTDGSPNCHVQKNSVSHAMSHLVSLYGRSSRNRLSHPPCLSLRTFPCSLCGLCDRLLNETGYVWKGGGEGEKKGQALWESLSLRAFCSTGHLQGHFLSSSALAKGSTVGQLAIELQPLLCGGVGQIRPHNCLGSQMGTAASLRPLKPATGCRPFGSHLCVERSAAVIVERFLPPLRRFFVGEGWEGAGRRVVNEWHLD